MKRVACSFLAVGALLPTLATAGCTSDTEDKSGESGSAQSTVSRPPQFVLLAFDGSLNLNFWEESRTFARDENVKFTYFISGVYFIPNASKRAYTAPARLGPGKSAIGWGGEVKEIAARYGQLQAAHDEGHEIASHANGHFDGSRWTEADWQSEFDQFDDLIWEGVGVIPGLRFNPRDSIGFRAPQLGHSPGLWPAMASHKYA